MTTESTFASGSSFDPSAAPSLTGNTLPTPRTGTPGPHLTPQTNDPATGTDSELPPNIQAKPTHESQGLVDEQLVSQTKQQIRSLVHEIAELSKTDCSLEDFYEGFLTRTVSALASIGGAIWTRPEPGAQLQLDYQINVKQTGLVDDPQGMQRHTLLLNKRIDAGEPTLVAPLSGTDDQGDAGNPTEHLLVLGPLKVDGETIGIVEIFQRPGAGPTTQRGYLRFLSQMCEIASDFLRNQRLRSFQQQQQMWQRLEQFISLVHRGLDTEQTIYTIANEGRQLIDCDRVSVATVSGTRARIRAVSGLDSIERRADQVKKLGILASKVVRSGQPLWYDGDDTEIPPQIEDRLHSYVDRSHTKLLAIIPLAEPDAPDVDPLLQGNKNPKQKKVLGALIVEQLSDSTITPALEQRVQVVAEHSRTALSNVYEHNSILLMPLWRGLGKLLAPFHVGNRLKTAMASFAVAAIVATLFFWTYPFALGASGKLIPESQFEVFAQVDGVLNEILVDDEKDSLVEKGQLLALMSNNDLMIEIQDLEGERDRTHEQIFSIQQSQIEDMSQLDSVMLNGELAKARATAASVERKLSLKRAEANLLEVRSPAAGQVVNWQVRQNLMRRPVSRGQKLMTVVDPDTRWQIELELPERRVNHLMNAMQETNEPLEVTFALASHPAHEFRGELISVDRKLEVHSDSGNCMLVRVGFPNEQIAQELLRTGTRVTAQIQCGERSLGYVLFYELIETVQSSFVFWF